MRYALALLLFASACRPRESGTAPSTAGSAVSAEPSSRVPIVIAAEATRDLAGVGEADVASPDVATRRAAARALARIASEGARPALLRLASDEDGDVAALALYGLGWTSKGHEDETVAALAARSASLDASRRGALDPSSALARALGKCATKDAEALLASWLRGPRERAAAAALALGDVGARRKLSDDTSVALTTAAATGLGEAFAAFGRMEPPDAAIATRVREVATARLATAGELRILAIRALGRTDAAAADPLAAVLVDAGGYTVAERAEAARALGRLSEKGRRALGEALAKLVPGRDPVSLSSLVSDAYGPLSAALEALGAPPSHETRALLLELARLPVPDPSAPTSLVRRVVHLRCHAAKLTAASGDDAALAACDPDSAGQEGQLARLAVLARGTLSGAKRRAALRALTTSLHAAVRSAALEAIGTHREVDDAAALVVEALASPHPGTVAAGAQLLALRPDLTDSVRTAGSPPPPDLGAAVLTALDRAWAPDDVETVATLVDAAGALRLAAARARVEAACASSWPTLRAHAARALEALGDKTARCTEGPPSALPAELSHPIARARLVLDTDAGELAIDVDGALAPMAATRLVELARAGFYDGMAVHRVVPGFVVQFGDRAGDGTGGAGRDPLRCETSPLPFVSLSVGVALSGRDTGSSQFFVTLARTPHLDGEYAILGRASGDWAAIAEGDRIRSIKVRDLAPAASRARAERRATPRRECAPPRPGKMDAGRGTRPAARGANDTPRDRGTGAARARPPHTATPARASSSARSGRRGAAPTRAVSAAHRRLERARGRRSDRRRSPPPSSRSRSSRRGGP